MVSFLFAGLSGSAFWLGFPGRLVGPVLRFGRSGWLFSPAVLADLQFSRLVWLSSSAAWFGFPGLRRPGIAGLK